MSITNPNNMRYLSDQELAGIKKILVIQLGPFGDGLLTTSYFETIKKRLPGSKLSYLIKEPYQKVILNHPYIDEIILIRKRNGLQYFIERIRTFLKIRNMHFDLVIDQQNMPSSQQITFFSGAKYRLGYLDARFHQAYNLKAGRREIQYSASRKFDILQPLRIDQEPYKLYFHIDEESHIYIENWLSTNCLKPEKLVCISPASPKADKQWLLTNFSKLADLIQNKTDLKVVLIWGPKEISQIESVKRKMKTSVIKAPPTNLNQAAALIKICKLLICNDGGLNHLAVTTKTPTLALFGNTDPAVWSPASEYKHHFHLYNPKFDSSQDNSFGISPEDVFNELQRILNLSLR